MGNGPRVSTGSVTGSGSSISVVCGFKPAAVDVINKDGKVALKWNDAMADASGLKSGNIGSAQSVQNGSDIKGSANTNIGIASGTLPTNGALLSTLANAANTTTMTIAVSPDVARNVSVSFKNTNVGASTGNAVSCVITGTFQGVAQTETISFTALELTSTAQNEVATKYGSKPFDTVTACTNPVAQPANWQHGVGIGSKIGLPNPLFGAAVGSVSKITKNAADLSPSAIVDATNNTVNLGTLADGDDFEIVYFNTVSSDTFITTLGITPSFNGFTIGADTSVNVNTNTLYWTAYRG